MTLFIFLTVIQALVAFVLVLLVLMQRSEGGGLGVGSGGSPGGFMSARGAADFLTRATKWTAVVFVVLAIVLAGVAINASGSGDIDQTLDRSVTENAPAAAVPAAGAVPAGAPAAAAEPAEADPLADVAE